MPPYQILPLQPTRFDGTSVGEMMLAHGSPTISLIGPFPEYAYVQTFGWLPGGPVPPPLAWFGNHPSFNGATWDTVADVTNGTTLGGPGNLYCLFACDYTTFVACGVALQNGPCPGTCAIYQTTPPHAVQGVAIPLPTSAGNPFPGPGIIDDSLHSAMSVGIDEFPTNPGMIIPGASLLYILDAEGDIEVQEVDFVTQAAAYYGTLSKNYITQGIATMMPVDCEVVDINFIPPGKPLPAHNLIAVQSFDPVNSVMTFDFFDVGPGLDNATPIYTGHVIPTNRAMRMDIDLGMGAYICCTTPSPTRAPLPCRCIRIKKIGTVTNGAFLSTQHLITSRVAR